MANGFLVITEHTWKKMPPEERDWIIYETLKHTNDRMKKLEKWNKPFSFIGGILGGFLAACGLKLTGG